MMNSTNDKLLDAQQDATDTGYIIGTVTTNEDPLGLGRIKVSIPELFPEGQESPWIGQQKHSPFGVGAGYGVYGSPKLGSKVRIKFQEGNALYGLLEADDYGLNAANAKFKDPNTWGFKDPSGSELFVNMQTGAWEFTHGPSNLTLKYDQQGNLKLTVPKDMEETVTGDSTRTVSGSLNLIVSGDTAIICDNDVNITANGNVTISGAQINLN